MKVYELILDEEQEAHGVHAISLVENPAMEEDFVKFSKEEVTTEFAAVDNEEHKLMGVVMHPYKPIYRNGAEGGYYVYASKSTVRKAAELFIKRSNQGEATVEHDFGVQGVSVIESWIVENPELDKTKSYGISAAEGSWIVTMKIDNDEIWNDYIKTGKVKGFSIEGVFAPVDSSMEFSNVWDEVLNIFEKATVRRLTVN